MRNMFSQTITAGDGKRIFEIKHVRVDQYMGEQKTYADLYFTIDFDVLGQLLGKKAKSNKSKQSRLQGNAIICEAVNIRKEPK